MARETPPFFVPSSLPPTINVSTQLALGTASRTLLTLLFASSLACALYSLQGEHTDWAEGQRAKEEERGEQRMGGQSGCMRGTEERSYARTEYMREGESCTWMGAQSLSWLKRIGMGAALLAGWQVHQNDHFQHKSHAATCATSAASLHLALAVSIALGGAGVCRCWQLDLGQVAQSLAADGSCCVGYAWCYQPGPEHACSEFHNTQMLGRRAYMTMGTGCRPTRGHHRPSRACAWQLNLGGHSSPHAAKR